MREPTFKKLWQRRVVPKCCLPLSMRSNPQTCSQAVRACIPLKTLISIAEPKSILKLTRVSVHRKQQKALWSHILNHKLICSALWSSSAKRVCIWQLFFVQGSASVHAWFDITKIDSLAEKIMIEFEFNSQLWPTTGWCSWFKSYIKFTIKTYFRELRTIVNCACVLKSISKVLPTGEL